jgi:hypothetical protein
VHEHIPATVRTLLRCYFDVFLLHAAALLFRRVFVIFARTRPKLASSFITLERVFAYYCRCIKNTPECFKFRQSIGPKEYALFCQECEITGEGKGKLSIIDSRRVFKQANMEVNKHSFRLSFIIQFLLPNYES